MTHRRKVFVLTTEARRIRVTVPTWVGGSSPPEGRRPLPDTRAALITITERRERRRTYVVARARRFERRIRFMVTPVIPRASGARATKNQMKLVACPPNSPVWSGYE